MSDRLWEKQAPARIHKPASKPETAADTPLSAVGGVVDSRILADLEHHEPAPAPVKKAAKKTKKS